MSKPTLLLNPGCGWAATTPFHYTLTLDNKYAHMGHKKENWYLKKLSNETDDIRKQFNNMYFGRKLGKRPKEGKRPREHPWGEILAFYNKYSTKVDLKPFLTTPASIENYISYYLSLWEVVKDDYAAVADFTNGNLGLSYDFLQEIAPKLREHFNVKVTFQFRDPIRRYFSEIGSLCEDFAIPDLTSDYVTCPIMSYKVPLVQKLMMRKKEHKKLFFYKLQRHEFSELCDFAGTYLKYSNVFGTENCYVTIMEDLWDKEQEKEQLSSLSNFLNYQVTTLHENVYVPDMGSNAPKYEFLEDQWLSDIEDLNGDDYDQAFFYMNTYYKDFESTFGYIPTSWKK